MIDGQPLACFQPFIDTATGRIAGVEALARMRLDDGRIVAAGEFHEAMLDPKVAYRISGQMLAAVAALSPVSEATVSRREPTAATASL